MDANIATVEGQSAIEGLDTLLDELVLEPGQDVSDAEIIEALDQDDEAAIDVLNTQQEAYQEQVSETNVSTDDAPQAADATPQAEPAKKGRKASGAAKTAKPKVERDLSALPAEFFILDRNASPADAETHKTETLGKRPTQKKVAEKFENLFVSLAAGRKPSVYTMACFDLVASKGDVTSGDLVAAMKAMASRKGGSYDDGTARSQVGQMMNLFAVVGIATRTGNKLTFNEDSAIAARLKAL